MTIFKKTIASLTAALLVLCLFSVPAYADSVAAPVSVDWDRLSLDASGYISWHMTLPEEVKSLSVKNYEVSMDLMTTGNWRENFRTFKTPGDTTDREISFTKIGIYRFKVRALFVGGSVSEWSGYSENCTVTSDYVTKEESNNNTYGPGYPAGPGSTYGPGSGVLPPAYGPGSTQPAQSYGPGSQNLPQAGILVVNSVPAWVEQNGTWVPDTFGNWTYRNNGIQYKSRWACIYTPYASQAAGQRQYDWFYFDEAGLMKTGWLADPTGNIFYLNPNSDGTRGRMVTGWAVIDGFYYYFNNVEGSGSMGALYRNAMTPDGHRVDASGKMIY